MTVALPSAAELRARYDQELRREARPGAAPVRVEREPRVTRLVATGPGGWNVVLWSDLEAGSADAAIAAEVARFAALGRGFEWKLCGHDAPADLAARLGAAGLVPGETELVLAGPAAGPGPVPLPSGLRVRCLEDAAGLAALVAVHDEVFGGSHAWLAAELEARLAAGEAAAFAVEATGPGGWRPVSAARVELHPGTPFASLWGGGTLPGWRGRGCYRALVAARAAWATALGARFLLVDALPTSRPILERLGFVALCTTTPFRWDPPRR